MHILDMLPEVWFITYHMVVIALLPQFACAAEELIALAGGVTLEAVHDARQVVTIAQSEEGVKVVVYDHVAQEPEATVVAGPLEGGNQDFSGAWCEEGLSVEDVAGDEVDSSRIGKAAFAQG